LMLSFLMLSQTAAVRASICEGTVVKRVRGVEAVGQQDQDLVDVGLDHLSLRERLLLGERMQPHAIPMVTLVIPVGGHGVDHGVERIPIVGEGKRCATCRTEQPETASRRRSASHP